MLWNNIHGHGPGSMNGPMNGPCYNKLIKFLLQPQSAIICRMTMLHCLGMFLPACPKSSASWRRHRAPHHIFPALEGDKQCMGPLVLAWPLHGASARTPPETVGGGSSPRPCIVWDNHRPCHPAWNPVTLPCQEVHSPRQQARLQRFG